MLFALDLLNNDELIDKLRAEKYDTMLVAPYDYCGLGKSGVSDVWIGYEIEN